MAQANDYDDTTALSEAEIQDSPMHGCVSVEMFRDDEITAPKKEYMFDFMLWKNISNQFSRTGRQRRPLDNWAGRL